MAINYEMINFQIAKFQLNKYKSDEEHKAHTTLASRHVKSDSV